MNCNIYNMLVRFSLNIQLIASFFNPCQNSFNIKPNTKAFSKVLKVCILKLFNLLNRGLYARSRAMADSTTSVSCRLFKKSFKKCMIQKLATSPSNFKCRNPLKTAHREKQEIHTTRNRISCAPTTKDGSGRTMPRKPSFYRAFTNSILNKNTAPFPAS